MLTKKQIIKKQIIAYFKQNLIGYKCLNEEQSSVFMLGDTDSVYLCTEYPNVIGGAIETTIRFGTDYLTCQIYYCQPVVKGDDQATRATRIINFCNHNLNWDCNELYEHYYVLDEENGDIFNFCRCRYELIEMYFLDTMNHILNFSTQQLANICIPVLLYTYDKISYKEATDMINREVRRIDE